jgi:hypothetical protein
LRWRVIQVATLVLTWSTGSLCRGVGRFAPRWLRRLLRVARVDGDFVLWWRGEQWELTGPDGCLIPVPALAGQGVLWRLYRRGAQATATRLIEERTGAMVWAWSSREHSTSVYGTSAWVARLDTRPRAEGRSVTADDATVPTPAVR